MSLHKMLDEVKQALRPDQSLLSLRDDILQKINTELHKRLIDATAVPGGSVAKNTFLAGDHDIDIFVRFALEYMQEEELLSDILEPVLKQFKAKRVHGSRDYFQFVVKDVEIEVIPVLAVDSAAEARNVTDMSPLHVQYFIAKNKEQEDEVRLAKQFCKVASVYGAESYIRGFSGHVIDILVLHYGSFYELVKAASRWKMPTVIDTENHHENALSAIDEAKHAPLVLVDPVQPERNAAAALSKESFYTFIDQCKKFLREPTEKFFVLVDFNEQALRERLKRHPGPTAFVYARHPDGDKKDVAGARVKKAFERLQKAVLEAGFTMQQDGWSFHLNVESVLWFSVEEAELPATFDHQGPPVSKTLDADRFRKAHPEAREENGRLWATVQRELRTVEQVLQDRVDSVQKEVNLSLRLEML